MPAGRLLVYVVMWLAVSAFSLLLWPDVFEGPGDPLFLAPPLLIAYHLLRGSADAWRWGLVFHAALSAGATALAIAHATLSEPDPVVIAFACGSWCVTAVFVSYVRLPSTLTKGWALFLAFVTVYFGWSGVQAALEARAEFPQDELSAPAPWESSASPPPEPDLSFFPGNPTLIAFGERNGVPWAIYTYRAKDDPVNCLGFTEGPRLRSGSCPLDFVAPDHLMSLSFSEGKSGKSIRGVVAKSVRGLELRLEGGTVQPVRIVEPPADAGLDVNVFFAFLPDGVGPDSYEITAFDSEGELVDRL